MTVAPLKLNANRTADVVCSLDHKATVPILRSSLYGELRLTCPTCGETSVHPIVGGSEPNETLQPAFLAVVTASGCVCGSLPANRPVALVRAHLKQHAQQSGGNFDA